jgi:hypothetical protein
MQTSVWHLTGGVAGAQVKRNEMLPWRSIVALGLMVLAFGGPLCSVGAQEATPLAAGQAAIRETYTLPDIPLASFQNEALPEHPIENDRGMLLGGIGSDLWQGPDDPDDEFWLVTDRGPNGQIEVDDENRRTFPVPDFTPLILHVKAADGALTVIEAFPIVNAAGEPVTGLSNLEASDEKPYDFAAAEELAFNPDGLDVEGLVRTTDGTFWLAEEYRPSLIKVDATGKVLARYVPEGIALPGAGYPVEGTLPAIYGLRQANRGFEGLALSGDGTTLYALLQSPLSNPDEETGEASRVGRILAVDVATGTPVAEYAYHLEAANEFDPAVDEGDQNEMKLSGLVWLDESTLLALERTDEVARLYTLDLTDATNILGSNWDDPATTPSLESLDLQDLAAAGVTSLAKTLLVDLEALPEMPDKIEGVTLVDDETIAVINDNDFDIGEFDETGQHVGDGTPSQLLVIETGAR